MENPDNDFWNDFDDSDRTPTVKQLQKRKEQLVKRARAALAGLPPRPPKRSREEILASLQTTKNNQN